MKDFDVMTELLRINNISFSTGANGRDIRVSAGVDEGCVLGVRGPSGIGKTTLLRILARLRPAEGGEVFLQGKHWTDFSSSQWRRRVHYLAQKPALFDGTVRENLQKPFELAAVKQDLRFDPGKAAELMERLFLSANMLDQDARTLSGGEASRLALVRALLVEPSILLLDEPLSALDHGAAGAVLDLMAGWLLGAPGRAMVIVSHVGELDRLPGFSVCELKGKEGGAVG